MKVVSNFLSSGLKNKILAMFIGCFLFMGILNMGFLAWFLNGSLTDTLVKKYTVCVSQISDEAKYIVANSVDPKKELQKMVEEKINQEEVAYAVVIDKDLVAIAHSDAQKIGKSYAGDAYTEDGVKNGKVKDQRFFAQVQKAWTYDVMVPIVIDGKTYGAMDVGFYEHDSKTIITNIIKIEILFTVVAFAIIAAILASMMKKIFKPLVETKELSNRMAQGDFALQFDEKLLARQDEVGMLTNGFKNICDSMNKTIGSIACTAQEVTASAEETTAVVEEITGITEMQASAMAETSNGMKKINEASKELSEKASELFNVINKANEKGTEAKDIAKETFNISKAGKEDVNKLVKEMNSIEGAIGKLSKSIEEMDKFIINIRDIVEFINNISEQTNLLALNAAIEAARAGESGRGFAVVAEEIRKLSESSGKATSDITNIINNLQTLAKETIKDKEESVTIINDSMVKLKETGTIFENINKSIDKNLGKIEDVSESLVKLNEFASDVDSATREQSIESHAIEGRISEITDSLQQVAHGISEVSQSTVILTDSILNLQDEISKFKV